MDDILSLHLPLIDISSKILIRAARNQTPEAASMKDFDARREVKLRTTESIRLIPIAKLIISNFDFGIFSSFKVQILPLVSDFGNI